MSNTPAAAIAPQKAPARYLPKEWGFWVALAALAIIVMLPPQQGLPVAGQYTLGIFLFAVIVWITEAIDYAVSAIVIATLMAFLLGLAPDLAKPDHPMGTGAALSLAMDGFTNTGVVLIAAALFIAEAMSMTGLDKRIALNVLSKVGSSTRRILIGTLLTQVVLSFFLPTSSARVACMAPIMLGMVAAFGLDKRSRFSSMLMIATTQASTITIIGLKTAAAGNLVTTGFIEKMLHTTITWLDWMIVAGPYALTLMIALYFIMVKMMPPEMEEIPGGNESIRKAVATLGPMTISEKKLLVLSVVLLAFWVTEGKLHHFDTSSTTIAAIALLLLPRIGIMEWKATQKHIAWGSILLTGIGVSLGTALLKTQAAGWLTGFIVGGFGLQHASAFTIFATMAMFMIVIHLGMSSAAALASAMIPIVIGVLQGVQTPGINVVGTTLLLGFMVGFGFILPVSGPHHMIALGTDTFEVKDFVRIGLVLAAVGYVLLLVFAATYWSWLGYL